jgi:hypothetical protein
MNLTGALLKGIYILILAILSTINGQVGFNTHVPLWGASASKLFRIQP